MTKRLTDPDFYYVPAAETDIRRTFDRIRKQLAEKAMGKTQPQAIFNFEPQRKKGKQ